MAHSSAIYLFRALRNIRSETLPAILLTGKVTSASAEYPSTTVQRTGREKVKVFGAWLDADVAGRKAGRGNQAAALIARAERGEQLTNAEKAEVTTESGVARGAHENAVGHIEHERMPVGSELQGPPRRCLVEQLFRKTKYPRMRMYADGDIWQKCRLRTSQSFTRDADGNSRFICTLLYIKKRCLRAIACLDGEGSRCLSGNGFNATNFG